MKKIITLVGLFSVVAIALSVGVAAFPTRAADHLDAPGLTSPSGEPALDINDVYAFQSPANKDNTVLIMTVSPAAGAIGPTTFSTEGRYEFLIDNDGDAEEDIRIRADFGKVEKNGQQEVKVRWSEDDQDRELAQGRTNKVIDNGGDKDDDDKDKDKDDDDDDKDKDKDDDDDDKDKDKDDDDDDKDSKADQGDVKVSAGLFDDPFFFDLNAFLGADNRSFCDGSETDFFLGLNTLAIVVEMPSKWFGNNNIGVWGRTKLDGDQIDRMGRPAINTVFIPNNPFEPADKKPSQKNAFNAGKPKNDQRDFRGEIVDTLEIFYGADSEDAQGLADILLPDILTFDTSSSKGFLNGRQLADDVIDAELDLVTNGAVPSDCVGNDSKFQKKFPYLAKANSPKK